MLVVLFAACPFVVSADEPASSPNATKQQLHGAIFSYMRSAKRKIDKAWERRHPTGKFFYTELKLTLDAKGKIAACTVVRASKSQQEELNSVQKCLSSVTFGHLPPGLDTLDFFWEFKTKDGRNSVEYSDLIKASSYYSNLLGGTLAPNGDWVVQSTAANNAVSLTETPPGVDFGFWMDSLQRRIKRAWIPPKGHESDHVVLVFRVHRSGLFSDLRIQKSSGVAVSDQAAIEAVRHCIFRPLPACPNDFIDVEFTFDFKVLHGGPDRKQCYR